VNLQVIESWRNIRNIDTVSFEDDLQSLLQTLTRMSNNVLTELLDKHAPVRFALLAAVHPSGSVDGSLMRRSLPSVCAGASNDVGVILVWKLIELSTD